MRDARMDKGLTLRQVAAELDIVPSYLSEIENDRRVPAEEVLRGLTQKLGLDFDEGMARAGRFGEATERYLRRHPDAVSLMRKVSAANFTKEDLQALSQHVEELNKKKET